MNRHHVVAALIGAGTVFIAQLAFGQDPPVGHRPLDPTAVAGADLVVVAGDAVTFQGWGVSPDDTIVEYAWDFDGDGQNDFVSADGHATSHVFAAPGDYRCLLTIKDTQGRVARATRHVIVAAPGVDLKQAAQALQPPRIVGRRPADGVRHWYALMINGGYEERFWKDVQLCYAMLTTKYGFSPGDIYLLNYDGKSYYGDNPNGMIDGAARLTTLQSTVAALAARVDEDDELFVWITDHGRGWTGPLSEGGKYLGYMDGRASVDSGDEPDFPESSFKLRSLFTGGDYRCNHGLNVWKMRKEYYSSTKTSFYRNKVVSRLDNVYIGDKGTTVADNDVYLEYLKDYSLGDLNHDGYIDTTQGEVLDPDGDGIAGYDAATGNFDEDDWGVIDSLSDNYSNANTGMPEGGWPYVLFDEGFQGKVCIDLGNTSGPLHVDGRDEDGNGLFDWMDVNQDGDTNDMVSVDESTCLYSDELYDDILADLLDTLAVAKMTIVSEPCFSGGIVEDLSRPNRVITTATIEEAVSWGNNWVRSFVAALAWQDENGAAVNADADGNGYVSMLEAFNYASAHDYADENPQFDDNGDGVSHTDPVPSGGDGTLGAQTYLGPTPPILHHFTWGSISSPVYAGASIPVTLTAQDSLGVLADSFVGSVSLSAWDSGLGTLTVGTGTTYTWAYPLNTNYHDCRTQVIYLASELGPAANFNSLALDVYTAPGQTLNNWTIRMKHTPLSAYSTAAWDATGWTVVYQKNETITGIGWRTFTFTTPFAYNGHDNVMIDFSINNTSWSAAGASRCSVPGANRSLYFYSDSNNGDPLTWSGTSPQGLRHSRVPNIQLGRGQAVTVQPATIGPFVGGVWNGSIRLLQTGQAVTLTAADGSGHTGATGALAVLTPPALAIDFDGDHDVDADDVKVFARCIGGSQIPYAPPYARPAGCTLAFDAQNHIAADIDQDGDVDLRDFGRFQRCFSGAGLAADPNCLN